MSTSPGRHPFFDDRHAVSWHRDLAAALAEAGASGKRVLVVHGGEKCGGTRALVERTITKQEIAEFLGEKFVAVASDPAAPDPAIAALVAALPKREPTPVCVYLAADGHVVYSTVGARPPAVRLNEMLEGRPGADLRIQDPG